MTTDNTITDYWIKYYVFNGACSLCGNSGIIHTEGVRTAAGVETGRANYCVCPQGQELRKLNEYFSDNPKPDET